MGQADLVRMSQDTFRLLQEGRKEGRRQKNTKALPRPLAAPEALSVSQQRLSPGGPRKDDLCSLQFRSKGRDRGRVLDAHSHSL